ncbi:MAG: tetratricopeptide repeat protein [Leptolyngbya sp. SIO4C5]|nr:tetratricopeptide repeat protein [Leptolyngbya sp. SIO4C5]
MVQGPAYANTEIERTDAVTELNNLYREGNALFRAGQLEAAVRIYQAAISLYQTSQQPHSYPFGQLIYNLGLTYRSLGRFSEAEATVQQAVEIAESTGDRELLGYSLGELGVIAYNRSDYPTALEFYQKALDISQEIADPQLESQTLDHIGVVYRRQGHYQQALLQHEAALDINQVQTENLSSRARILNNIGIVYGQVGEYAQALEFNIRALALSRQISDRLIEARILLSLGAVYSSLSNYAQALEFYQNALAIWQVTGSLPGAGRTVNNIGSVYASLGDYEQALVYYQQALDIRRSIGDRIGEGLTLSSIGLVYWHRGQYLEAKQYYQSALEIAQTVGDRPGEANILNYLGSVAYSQSNYATALSLYQQALMISQSIGERAAEGYNLNSVGSVYHALGELESALGAYQQALALRREIGERRGEAITLNNIGLIHDLQGQSQRAIEVYQQALTLRQAIGDRAGEAATLTNLGLAYISQADYTDALAVYEQALAIQLEIGDTAGEAITLNHLGLVYQRLNRSTAAFETYQQALARFEMVGNRAGAGATLSSIGFLLTAQNQPELAILFFKEAISTYESIRQDNQPLSSELQDAYTATVEEVYRALADLLLQQDRVLEAQQVLDLLKVQELRDYLRSVSSSNRDLIVLRPEQMILDRYDSIQQSAIAVGQELAQLRQIELAQRTVAQQQRLATLVALQTEINSQFNDFIESEIVQTLIEQLSITTRRQSVNLEDLTALQENLAQLDAAILYPLILGDRLELVLTTPYAPPLRRTVNVSRQELNQAILDLRQALLSPISDAVRPAQQLYTWLIEPIVPDLEQAQVSTIIYSPDGQLRYIPLSVLHSGSQWLIEQYRVNNITARSLQNIETQPAQIPTVLAAAFSDENLSYPHPNEEGAAFFGLPFAGKEVEILAETIPSTRLFIDEQFSLSTLQPIMNEHSILHLATHAAFVPGEPEESFIVFGNGDTPTLDTIKNWQLNNVDLVVLSACETGLGGILGDGEEVLGLGYQFQRAGARSVLASLWQVSDGGTQVLMNAFYSALREGNRSKAEALQRAQLALITGNESLLGLQRAGITIRFQEDRTLQQTYSALSHPYYWAPFILIGNGL